MWIFVHAVLIKTTLKQDREEEGRSKAEKIIAEGNLNFSFVFCFKELLILWFSPARLPLIFLNV